MAAAGQQPAKSSPIFAPQYIHGVYIPSVLLLLGTTIVKKEWLPFAALFAVAFGGWRIYSSRESDTESDTIVGKV